MSSGREDRPPRHPLDRPARDGTHEGGRAFTLSAVAAASHRSGAQRLVVIAGPTGTGKSDLSLELADRLNGEIVNADSMQLYRGMDIGTAKVPVAHRHGIAHHQLDVLDIAEAASVAAYRDGARAAIAEILHRGRTPLLVGGSGLYIRAVVDELDFPATDATVRAYWQERLVASGAGALHRILADHDPAAASSIEASDGRRVVRALEVIELTGRPYSAQMPVPGPPRWDAALFLLDRPTGDLDTRLADRVDAMLRAGFLDEVRALERRGLRTGPTAPRALGYAQLLDHLAGLVSLGEARDQTVQATRRFVRRQRSWFGRDPRWMRIDAHAPDVMETVVRGVTGQAGETSGSTASNS